MKVLFCVLLVNISIFGYCQESTRDTIYKIDDVDIKPEFPGGMEKFGRFMVKNFRFPDERIKGKVISVFVIEKDGYISEIEIIQDAGYGTGEEYTRVLKKSPKWKPGKKNGSPVRTKYMLPLNLNREIHINGNNR
ncbi:TonB protein C-terminal [Flavobacterium swingsii]|jgi:protein TonB|uniref:TonB protein C-terminal n=1 Tax=Flavobacterium swingsii TaxID=498292 RepID=A0A1I0ZQT9_9FLAO|nr:energy transducer TonB [Flavobacterium swingsii]SFB27871.1 TonB protein C-terminal [Flavobacterium swingsii]